MLTLISTPIGNLSDICDRSRKALEECELLACEDTRQTRKLLSLLGLKTKAKLISYHDHNGAKIRPKIIDALSKGIKVGLVSDAGTPLISDPGYKLVKEVREQGYAVTATAGACSPILALILSGLPSDRFLFHGFLPDKTKQATTLLQETKQLQLTSIFFVSPSQCKGKIALIKELWGDRPASLVRELTKLHEEVITKTLSALEEHLEINGMPKGELVLLVGPAEAQEDYSQAEIEALLAERLKSLSLKDAVAEITSQTGRPRKDIYQLALRLKPE